MPHTRFRLGGGGAVLSSSGTGVPRRLPPGFGTNGSVLVLIRTEGPYLLVQIPLTLTTQPMWWNNIGQVTNIWSPCWLFEQFDGHFG